MNVIFEQRYTDDYGKISFSYAFGNDLPGSAAGIISLSCEFTGVLSVYWGKDGRLLTVQCNEKVLSYSALHTFHFIKEGEKQEKKILGFTAIPVDANCLILTGENKVPVLTLAIAQEKLLPSVLPRYSFGVIADIHYNYFFSNDKTIDYAVPAIDRALAFYKSAGCAHVCAAGDYGIYSEEKSYQDFSRAIDKGGITVIACGGNHELYAKIPVMYGENGYWRTYMNKGVYDRSLDGVLDIASNGIDFTYSVPGHPSEVFVFLSQWYWDGHTSKQPKLLEPEQLIWLEEQFQKHSDKTVFLLFHTYLADDDGENVDGEGDLRSTGGYSYNGHYNTHTPDEKKLRALLTKYKNVIWFNGHSHYEYAMQMYNENLNIFDYEGTTATMIHVPSVTNPRTVKPDATTYSSLRGKNSQGALQFVYDGFQIMNGVNIWENEILSYACYIIYTDKNGIVQSGNITENISWVFHRQLSSLRITGSGDIPDYTKTSPPWNIHSDHIERLYTGKGITKIGSNAFSDLSLLKRVEIKEGVKVIRENAFHAPMLETLILPETLRKIENEVFVCSDKITQIIYDGTGELWNDIQLGDNVFTTVPTLCPRKMVIGFEDDRGITFFNVPLGQTPHFDEIPIKDHPDEDKYYVFVGWSDNHNIYPPAEPLPAVTQNTLYTAKFGTEEQRYISGSLASEKIRWCLDRKQCHLTVSGEGAIPDFDALGNRPWDPYSCSVSVVTVKGGITEIGANAFKQLPALKTVILEEGVRVLGRDAIGYNKLLKAVYIPSTLKELGRGSVYLSDHIDVVYYGAGKEDWENFCAGITTYYNTNLTNVKHIVFNYKQNS
ncbi:MAG: hypothetical protein E7616_08415 [Ruminococcaceae bacterium]|nr:hypothetical protein [Oscillospiraceae bacterium]